MGKHKIYDMHFLGFLLLFGRLACLVQAKTRHYDFVIKEASYTRLCHTKKILTVNGYFPGPTIKARKGDTVIVRVYNQGHYNVTIHWHGVDQPRNPWNDGPEYITQCPIKPGAKFTYRILLSEEEGTLWWHAHSDWSRSTVYGAMIVHPKLGKEYPFPKPYKEIPIILGQWWNQDVREILDDILKRGGDVIRSDAYTINGQPGDLYPCSREDTFTVKVEHGKTYLLRVINAALQNELFFAVGGHQLTLVGTDASYTKPWTTDYIMVAPGQTMDLLLRAEPLMVVQKTSSNRYYIAARAYNSGDHVEFDNTTTTAVLNYIKTASSTVVAATTSPLLPTFPLFNDTNSVTGFTAGLRSLSSENHPIDVPKFIDERIVITITVNLLSCPNNSCVGPLGMRLSSSLNNISFVKPSIDILRAYYENIGGVFGSDFPDRPLDPYNFTGDNLPKNLSLAAKLGTQVRVLEYGRNVEVVFQGTNLLTGENHPIHLHGYRFYVVGRGFGNFDVEKDPLGFNLVDPPLENTVGVPKSGWTAIRFRARNPGRIIVHDSLYDETLAPHFRWRVPGRSYSVWFMHCHMERHMTWGMDTVFIVKNGATPETQMLPPPLDMPPCNVD